MAIDVVDGKWKVFILWELSTGSKRFGELRRLIAGVSEKVLAQQLRELEEDHIVHRREYDEAVPRVEYSLTEAGMSLNTALMPLAAWGDRNRATVEAVRQDPAEPATMATNPDR